MLFFSNRRPFNLHFLIYIDNLKGDSVPYYYDFELFWYICFQLKTFGTLLAETKLMLKIRSLFHLLYKILLQQWSLSFSEGVDSRMSWFQFFLLVATLANGLKPV